MIDPHACGYVRQVVSLDDVSQMAKALPDVEEGERRGTLAWSVGGKIFAWERNFSKADIKRYGEQPVPQGPVVAVRVEDLGEKEAVLAAGHRGFFTISHFDGYPAVLIQLKTVAKRPLRDALEDGWLACASEAQIRAFLAGKRPKR